MAWRGRYPGESTRELRRSWYLVATQCDQLTHTGRDGRCADLAAEMASIEAELRRRAYWRYRYRARRRKTTRAE